MLGKNLNDVLNIESVVDTDPILVMYILLLPFLKNC